MSLNWQIALFLAIIGLLTVRLVTLGLPLHMDEFDYLFIGRRLLEGTGWPSLSYVFGANFNWYGFAWLERHLPGYPGPRLFSFLLGLLSLAASYVYTYALWRCRRKAVLGVLLLAVSAPHIFISSISTYDALAVTLAGWSLALLWLLLLSKTGVHSTSLPRWRSHLLFGLSISTLLAAVLAKYVVILFLPPLFVFSLLVVPAYAMTGAVVLATVLTGYFFINKPSLLTLYETQINGIHGANATTVELMEQLAQGLLLPTLVITGGLLTLLFVRLYKDSGKTADSQATTMLHRLNRARRLVFSYPYLPFILLLAAIMPIYHLYAENRIALTKHLAFSQFLLIPIVAYFLVQAYDWIRLRTRSNVVAAAVTAAFVTLYSLDNARHLHTLKRAYPDLTGVIALWQARNPQQVATDKILSEDPYLFRYLSDKTTDQAFISETSWLDNDLDGNFTAQDVKDALWDKKFDWVLLTDQLHPLQNVSYRRILALRGYALVYRKPYYLSASLSGNRLGVVELFRSYKTLSTIPDYPMLADSPL